MTATQPVVPPGLRSRVLDASRRARAAGEPVPGVPAISPADGFRRATHVESAQAAANRQAGRDPSATRDEWRDAVRRSLDLIATGSQDLDETVVLHGMRLPLRALLVVLAFELWVHENDIRCSA